MSLFRSSVYYKRQTWSDLKPCLVDFLSNPEPISRLISPNTGLRPDFFSLLVSSFNGSKHLKFLSIETSRLFSPNFPFFLFTYLFRVVISLTKEEGLLVSVMRSPREKQIFVLLFPFLQGEGFPY